MHPSQWAARRPAHPAIVVAATGATLDYAALEAASNRGAHLFRRLGLVRGDRIAIWYDNRPDYLAICWAAERAGLVFVPVATRLTPAEAAHIIVDCGARAVIAGAGVAAAAREVMAHPALGGAILAVVGATPPDALDWARETATMPASPIADQSGGRPMLYSSGTTGRPKGVVHAERPRDITAEHHYEPWLCADFGLDEDAVFASPAPLHHAAPLVFSLTAHRLGATVVLFERFDAEAFLAAVARHRITHAQLVPTMMIRLLRLPEEVRRRHDLSSLRAVIHSGAPCPVPVKHAMIAWLGPIVHEYYGGSEGFGRTCILASEWLERPGSVGRARYGTIHVCGEDGAPLPPGETGRIWFESDMSFAYHGDPERTRAAGHPAHPRWRSFGDIGHVDADGYLTLTDRAAFMIVSGGVNIYPQEVEDLLATHPLIADAGVIGVPDDDMGEQVKAIVQLEPGTAPDAALAAELIAWCRDRLAHYKCPRSIDFAAALPRYETGKLAKHILREAYRPAMPP